MCGRPKRLARWLFHDTFPALEGPPEWVVVVLCCWHLGIVPHIAFVRSGRLCRKGNSVLRYGCRMHDISRPARTHENDTREKMCRLEMEILTGDEEWEHFWTGLGVGSMKGWASWVLPNRGVNIIEVEANASVDKGRQKSSRTIDLTVRVMLSNDTL